MHLKMLYNKAICHHLYIPGDIEVLMVLYAYIFTDLQSFFVLKYVQLLSHRHYTSFTRWSITLHGIRSYIKKLNVSTHLTLLPSWNNYRFSEQSQSIFRIEMIACISLEPLSDQVPARLDDNRSCEKDLK